MADQFAFNAPQHYDFSVQNEVDESYFGDELVINQIEEQNRDIPVQNVENDPSESDGDSIFMSPMTTMAGIEKSAVKPKNRRSLSTSDLFKHVDQSDDSDKLRQEFGNLKLTDANPNQLPKAMHFPNRLTRSRSQDRLNKLAEPKRVPEQGHVQTRFISLAEAVNKFHKGTPDRFRLKKETQPIKKCAIPWGALTKPHSPKLTTTRRARGPTCMSRQEVEELEIQEAKKYQIKSHPVNQKILSEPFIPKIEKKPVTVAQPFHLSGKQYSKNTVGETKPKIFHAQPMPKASAPLKAPPRLMTTTMVAPFSFEKRDQNILKKKQEFIQHVFQEEKKAREFHANPLPKSILRARNGSLPDILNSKKFNSKSDLSVQDEPDKFVFKARPAAVLKAAPFIPKIVDHQTVIEPFSFSTDERVLARHKLEEEIQKKELLKAKWIKETEERRRIEEEEEIKRLRKAAEHKAQPIKHYKPVPHIAPKPLTEPMTPNFRTAHLRDKENVSMD